MNDNRRILEEHREEFEKIKKRMHEIERSGKKLDDDHSVILNNRGRIKGLDGKQETIKGSDHRIPNELADEYRELSRRAAYYVVGRDIRKEETPVLIESVTDETAADETTQSASTTDTSNGGELAAGKTIQTVSTAGTPIGDEPDEVETVENADYILNGEVAFNNFISLLNDVSEELDSMGPMDTWQYDKFLDSRITYNNILDLFGLNVFNDYSDGYYYISEDMLMDFMTDLTGKLKTVPLDDHEWNLGLDLIAHIVLTRRNYYNTHTEARSNYVKKIIYNPIDGQIHSNSSAFQKISMPFNGGFSNLTSSEPAVDEITQTAGTSNGGEPAASKTTQSVSTTGTPISGEPAASMATQSVSTTGTPAGGDPIQGQVQHNIEYYVSTSKVAINNFMQLLTNLSNLPETDKQQFLNSISYQDIKKLFLGREYIDQDLNITSNNFDDFSKEIKSEINNNDAVAQELLKRMKSIIDSRTASRTANPNEVNITYIPRDVMSRNQTYFMEDGYIDYHNLNVDLRKRGIDPKNTTASDLKSKFKRDDGQVDFEASFLVDRIIHSENYKNHRRSEVKCFLKAHSKIIAGAAGLGVGLGVSAFKIIPTVTQPLATIRLGYAIGKTAVRVYSKIKHGDKDYIEKKIQTSLDSKFESSQIYQGIKRINAILKKPEVQWFLNGMSIGVVAGNMLHLHEKLENVFNSNANNQSVASTTDTPNGANDNSYVLDDNGSAGDGRVTQSLEDFTSNQSDPVKEILKNAEGVTTPSEGIDYSWLDNFSTGTGDTTFNLSSIDNGFTNSLDALGGNNPVHLASKYFENCTIERVRFPDGSYMTGNLGDIVQKAQNLGLDLTQATADVRAADGSPLAWMNAGDVFKTVAESAQNAAKVAGKSM
jgi:hypothetical protein